MQDVENLLSQMTLQEKVAMLADTNMWYTVPVERLGIPSLLYPFAIASHPL